LQFRRRSIWYRVVRQIRDYITDLTWRPQQKLSPKRQAALDELHRQECERNQEILTCVHDWANLGTENIVYDTNDTGTKQAVSGQKTVYQCSKCGEFKVE